MARAVMVALWVAWAAAAWWSAPRPATVEQLHSDLAAGHVVSFSRAESWVLRRSWIAPVSVRHSPHGGMLVWATSSGRVRHTTPESVVETAWLAERLEQSDVGRGTESPVSKVATGIALLLIVVGLGVLLGGPAPARGTRWFWFWVGQVPLGLGYLAWLLWERPWAAPGRYLKNRQNGWTGLGFMILGGIALSGLTFAANRFLGPWLIPA